jgi:hypothetical protein
MMVLEWSFFKIISDSPVLYSRSFSLLKNWIEQKNVLSAVCCSCVSLFDVTFENGLSDIIGSAEGSQISENIEAKWGKGKGQMFTLK